MNTSKNGANIIKRILGNRNNLLMFALLGALILILAIPTESGRKEPVLESKEEKGGETEERLERILKNTEGVGNVRVMITKKERENGFSGEQEESGEVEGVVIVAEGARDSAVKKKIQDIVMALFSIEAHKIEIVKMKAD